MYLSKVHVAWVKAHNPYEVHRAVWTLFPGHERDTRGFLFRVDTERQGVGAELLVQSAWSPERRSDEAHVMATRQYLPMLRQRQQLRFRLVSNPVKTLKDEKGRRNGKGEVKSCRVPLINEDQQLEWLNRKLQAAANVETAVVHAIKPMYFRKGGQAGKVVAVTFDGLLMVIDPELLWQRIQTGVGPAKSLGCGLLSIARA